MPKPPFSAYLGLRGSVSERIATNSPRSTKLLPQIQRKISDGLPLPIFTGDFVSQVDASSIYDQDKLRRLGEVDQQQREYNSTELGFESTGVTRAYRTGEVPKPRSRERLWADTGDFVSTVDSSSIYGRNNEEHEQLDNNRIYHVLKQESPRIADYTSPEMLPPHMIELKVSQKTDIRILMFYLYSNKLRKKQASLVDSILSCWSKRPTRKKFTYAKNNCTSVY